MAMLKNWVCPRCLRDYGHWVKTCKECEDEIRAKPEPKQYFDNEKPVHNFTEVPIPDDVLLTALPPELRKHLDNDAKIIGTMIVDKVDIENRTITLRSE